MNVQSRIEDKLAGTILLAHMEVINESDRHNVPSGSESHFKLVLVSDEFTDLSLLDRHRWIYRLLGEELATGLHALSIYAYTTAEWKKRSGATPVSPPCLGGNDSAPKFRDRR
jgi:BolA protein